MSLHLPNGPSPASSVEELETMSLAPLVEAYVSALSAAPQGRVDLRAEQRSRIAHGQLLHALSKMPSQQRSTALLQELTAQVGARAQQMCQSVLLLVPGN